MNETRLQHLKKNIDKLKIDIEAGVIKNRSMYYKQGRLMVTLAQKEYRVHEVIAFAGGLDILDLTVNHKDGNKMNNRIDNLEAITRADNIKHGWENGLFKSNGSKSKGKHFNGRYTTSFIQQLKDDYNDGLSYGQLTKKYNVPRSTAHRLINQVL